MRINFTAQLISQRRGKKSKHKRRNKRKNLSKGKESPIALARLLCTAFALISNKLTKSRR